MTSHQFIPNIEARKILALKLNLPYHDDMQDWEYEVSDINRIGEFLFAYDHLTNTDAEKESLMEVILDSINQLVSMKQDVDVSVYISEVKKRFEDYPSLHNGTIHYWENNGFNISELLK